MRVVLHQSVLQATEHLHIEIRACLKQPIILLQQRITPGRHCTNIKSHILTDLLQARREERGRG